MDSCGNQTWKVGVLNHAAFHLTQVNEKWIGVDGRDFEILKVLSDRLNFRYELIPSVDKQWGSCNDDGICGGLVGMVVRKEIDIAISSMTSTAARAKYCDFSYPYFQDELTFVTKKPDMKMVNSMFFVKPFQIQLWIFVVGFLSILILVTKTMHWLNLFETKLFELQNLTAIILKQDASIPTSMNESPSLIIVAFLLVLVGCTCKIYECTLTSATSLTTASQPLDKLEDMIEAIKNQDYVIGSIVGSAPYYRIMSSELEYLKIFANSTRKKGYQLHRSHKEGLIRALNQNFATVGAKLLLKKTALESGLDLSKFHFASDYLFMDQNSVVFGRDFRCKDVINKCLVVLAGAGLMTKWEMRSNWRMNNGTAKHTPNEKYIDFSDLKLVIIGLILAYSFALAVLEQSAMHLKKIVDQWKGVSGRDFEILEFLSNKMNFRYDLVIPSDKLWGSCDDRGNCSGIIGMVANREADMAISSLTKTAARAKYVEFSTSYFQDVVTFATRKPDTRLTNSVFFTKPFESRVWISVACFVCIFIAMTKILDWLKVSRSKLFRVKNLISILLRQDVSLEMATRESLSLIIAASLLVSAGCVNKLYECTLTSATSSTSASRPLDTLEEMADAIKNEGYSIGATFGTSTYYQILSSRLEHLKLFANSMKQKGSERHRSTMEGFIRTLNEKYAHIESKTGLKKIALNAGLDLSRFHFAREYVFLDHLAIVYGKTFRCKDAVNNCLYILAGSDLVTKWEMKNNWLLKKSIATDIKSNQIYIEINDFKLVLFGLVVGFALASSVLIIEVKFMRICKLYSVWRNKYVFH